MTRELTNPSLQAARTSIESEQRRLSTAAQNPGLSDGALVSAVRAGNQDAMAQLYDRYSQVVYAVAMRVLGDTAAAEDVLQEIFMQLWRNPGDSIEPGIWRRGWR